jgi:vesicle transport through interaction with t-SNAREs 1
MSEEDSLKKIDSEVNDLIMEFQTKVSKLKGKSSDNERVQKCEEIIKKIELAMENFQVDLGSLEDPSIRPPWQKKMDKHSEVFLQTKSKFLEKKKEVEKVIFLKTKEVISAKGKGMTGDEDISTLDRQGALALGDVIVNKANASLDRTKKIALETEQIGVATLQKMQEQSEKMDSIYENLEHIEGNIARSRKLIGKIAQSAVNDRFIQLLCVLIMIATIVVITLQKTSTVTTSSSTNSVSR